MPVSDNIYIIGVTAGTNIDVTDTTVSLEDPIIVSTLTGTYISGSQIRAAQFTGSFSGSFIGNGSGLTGVSATVSDPLTITTLTASNTTGSDAKFTTISASFSGSGTNIFNITASNIQNFETDVRAKLSSGTNLGYSSGQFSLNTTLTSLTTITSSNITGSEIKTTTISASNVTGSDAKFTTVTASFSGSGADITTLNAGNISAGTLSVSRGGTGGTTFTSASLLVGNNGNTFGTITPTGNSGSALVSDGTSWIAVATSSFIGAGNLTITDATDNRVVTSTGGTGLNAESNLTYDGTTLLITGSAPKLRLSGSGATSFTLKSQISGKDNRYVVVENSSSNFSSYEYRDYNSNEFSIYSGSSHAAFLQSFEAGTADTTLVAQNIYLTNPNGSTIYLRADDNDILIITGSSNLTVNSNATLTLGGKDVTIATVSQGSSDNIIITTANSISSSNITVNPLFSGSTTIGAGLYDGDVTVRTYNGKIQINSAEGLELTGSNLTLQTISNSGNITLRGACTRILTDQFIQSFHEYSNSSATFDLDPNLYTINYIVDTYAGSPNYYISGSTYGEGHRFTLVVSASNSATISLLPVTSGTYRSTVLSSSTYTPVGICTFEFIAVNQIYTFGSHYTTTWIVRPFI